MKGSQGIKGLILITCGSAVTNTEHFESLKALVDK